VVVQQETHYFLHLFFFSFLALGGGRTTPKGPPWLKGKVIEGSLIAGSFIDFPFKELAGTPEGSPESTSQPPSPASLGLPSWDYRNEWVDVLKSNIWDIPEERSGIVPALMLSYHHLPSHLKRCFMYCSILPKDYEFEEQQLVLLWIADGLIHPQQGEENMQMEDLGRKYFRELLSRSFFQQSNIKESQFEKPSWYSSNHSSTKKPRFVMHDLINDLAQWVAGDICFRMEDRIGGRNERRLSKKARYSSYLAGNMIFKKSLSLFLNSHVYVPFCLFHV
jgi:hypothetical protein